MWSYSVELPKPQLPFGPVRLLATNRCTPSMSAVRDATDYRLKTPAEDVIGIVQTLGLDEFVS